MDCSDPGAVDCLRHFRLEGLLAFRALKPAAKVPAWRLWPLALHGFQAVKDQVIQVGVSINRATPKWLVYNGTSHLEMDDLEVPLFQETSKYRDCIRRRAVPHQACLQD